MDPWTTVALAALSLHFGAPAAYILYLNMRRGRRPGAAKISRLPKLAVIVPTYNEAATIEEKLDNIFSQDYPRDRLSVYVVDSASTDNTAGIAEGWAAQRPGCKVVVIRETRRLGKAHALNTALGAVEDADVVVITDADALWPRRDTLVKVASYIADDEVGAVSCLKVPRGAGGLERTYRQWYNKLRLWESEVYATPIFHGELAAFKLEVLREGFPMDIGADDSYMAIKAAIMGKRAVTPDDVICTELVPRKGYLKWRLRRAQHLIQAFLGTLREIKRAPRVYKPIYFSEAYLHIVNPWLFLISIISVAVSATSSAIGILLAIVGLIALAYAPFRAWALNQLILVAAAVRNLYARDIVWEKQEKR